MGFYGNITSTNKTQFTFDRIYPSRKVMDEALTKRYEDSDTFPGDGVFIGRFVLVDYEDGEISGYFPIYKKDNSGVFYADSSFNTVMTLDLCKANDIFQYQAGSMIELWQATGNSATTTIKEETVEYATFTQVTNSKYEANYKADINKYGPGRGYDGTVWQKVFADNAEKYVMIAELNSVVPTFKITVDAPTMTPLAPHFDKQSNNVAYWLHWQPQWGMRVKGANEDSIGSDGQSHLSDEKVVWKEPIFDENNQILSFKEIDPQPGAIYYNKAGFDPEVHSYSNEKDAIKIEPTGKSGTLYNDHLNNTNNQTIQEDIQEISIMLPSLGNAISTIWDLTYGDGKNTDNNRNLDINWDSYNGLRMIKENESGTGFSYNKEQVSTIAGAINSVHDLMGQFIIMDEIPSDSKDYADEIIYYDKNGGFYKRKFISYDYEKINDISEVTNDKLYTKVNLLTYEPNTYYVKRNANDYFLSTSSNFYKYRNYYNITSTEKALSFEYKKNTLYYKTGNNYYLETAEEARSGIAYYKITSSHKALRFYKTNTYYIKDDSGRYVQSTTTFNENETYYTIEGGKPTVIVVEKQDENGISYYVEETVMVGGTPKPVTLVAFGNYYKKESNNYIKLVESDIVTNGTQICYQLTTILQPDFYTSGVYYYKENNNFIFDKNGNEGDETKQYYILTVSKVNEKFYYANNYYYIDENNYLIDSNNYLTSGRDYYEKNYLYVISDSNNIYQPGMVWKETVEIPEGLEVGFRTEKNELKEIEGFARSFNTIHGLILEIRRLLDAGNQETRDMLTVQGAINQLNDIIAKFGDIEPNKLLFTDSYGRINSATYSGDAWVSWEMDTNINGSNVGIVHNEAQTAVKTISQGNKNPQFGATITTPKIAIDEKGHVGLVENENVTLPKPSLTSNGSGVLTGMTLVDTTGVISTTYTNLTDVKLDGYTKTLDTGALADSDSLEIGLSKLENSISLANEALEETALELEAANTALSDRITVNENKLTGISTTVSESITTAVNSLANGQVKTNTDNIAAEITNRTNADNALSTRIAEFEANGANDVWALDLRVQDNTSKITAIEDKFKESDIAEDGTTTVRTSGYMKWNVQDVAPTVTEGIPTIWIDTATGEIKLYNGSIWVVLTATAVV